MKMTNWEEKMKRSLSLEKVAFTHILFDSSRLFDQMDQLDMENDAHYPGFYNSLIFIEKKLAKFVETMQTFLIVLAITESEIISYIVDKSNFYAKNI